MAPKGNRKSKLNKVKKTIVKKAVKKPFFKAECVKIDLEDGEFSMCESAETAENFEEEQYYDEDSSYYYPEPDQEQYYDTEDNGDNSSHYTDWDNIPEGRENHLYETEVPIKDNIRSIFCQTKKNVVKVKKSVSFDVANNDLYESEAPDSKLNQKKKKRKKGKKPQKEEKVKTKTVNKKSPKNEKAINYLLTWKKDRNNWKFEKLTQVWLLKHMFSKEDIPDKIFKLLLQYVAGLKGAAKNLAVSKCQEIISKTEKSVSEKTPEGSKDNLKEVAYSRARSLLQYIL